MPLRAVVDSGASRSFLSRQRADALGLAACDLENEPFGGQGVGSVFPIWRPRRPVHARVTERERDRIVAWGPALALEPVFADIDIAVLGRADFFRHFRVTFEEGADPPRFHLDYGAD